METERDRLIRKGILTPFDSVDGFERRIQQRLSSSKPTAGTQPRRCEPFVDPRLKQLAAKASNPALAHGDPAWVVLRCARCCTRS